MKIAIVGTGYVGLVTGAGFAELGHSVTCVDHDRERIERLCRGEIPIHEPGLAEIVQRNTARGRLRFVTTVEAAVPGAQIAFIAVGTPGRPDGAADLGAVLSVARDIAHAIDGYTVVVTKSTVPVGTTDKVRELVAQETRQAFAVASNPEFLKEGDALNDFLKPARVVVGADDPRAIQLMRELYRTVMRTSDRILVMDVRSAELTKYAANAMLATRISFMNEMAQLAEMVGADIESIRKGIGTDPRIGSKFLFAGCGFGGSCLKKDLRALIHTGQDHDVHLRIAEAADQVNERQQRGLARRVISHFGGRLDGRRIAVWGLAFKPETDDIRDAPALQLIQQLRAAGAQVAGYDPAAMPNVQAQLGADAIELAPDAYAAAEGADALVLVTEWHELRYPDLERLKSIMRTHAMFDGRNVWPAEEARRAGFFYLGIGRRAA